MLEALQFEFMRNALITGVLTAVICGVIGTLVVVNRLSFLAGGIAHSAYGGIGLATLAGWPYMLGATLFALFSGGLMAAVSLHARERADTIIGVMWAVGMASGIVMLDMSPGYNVDLMSYLFGSILTVPMGDVLGIAILGAVLVLLVVYFYQDFLIMSYDEEFARVRGVPVRKLYFLLIGMVAVTVVMVVQVVGLILVIAMLTIPPFIAEKYTISLARMMFMSSCLGVLFIGVGLWFSYNFDITSGAAIILAAGSGFGLSLIIDKAVELRQRQIWLKLHERH